MKNSTPNYVLSFSLSWIDSDFPKWSKEESQPRIIGLKVAGCSKTCSLTFHNSTELSIAKYFSEDPISLYTMFIADKTFIFLLKKAYVLYIYRHSKFRVCENLHGNKNTFWFWFKFQTSTCFWIHCCHLLVKYIVWCQKYVDWITFSSISYTSE